MPFICEAGESRPDTQPGALHHLKATPGTVHWGYFDAALRPGAHRAAAATSSRPKRSPTTPATRPT